VNFFLIRETVDEKVDVLAIEAVSLEVMALVWF